MLRVCSVDSFGVRVRAQIRCQWAYGSQLNQRILERLNEYTVSGALYARAHNGGQRQGLDRSLRISLNFSAHRTRCENHDTNTMAPHAIERLREVISGRRRARCSPFARKS